MRTENEVRELYTQYLYRHALADQENDKRDVSNQLLGAAFAYGRTLGYGMKRIRLDVKAARAKLERQPELKNMLMRAL